MAVVRIKVKDLKKNEGLWKFYQWSKIAEKLTDYNELSNRQEMSLANKIFSLLDWDRLKCRALADLADFNGKTYELKLNQRAIKSAKVLHDTAELKRCVLDLLGHNFMGYSGDELPKEVRDFEWDNWWELEKWFNAEIVREIQAFILQELTEKAHSINYEKVFDKIYYVADYLEVKDLMEDMDYNIIG